LIDTDGMFVNLHTHNSKLNSMILESQKGITEIDFFAGRKLPEILASAGLNDVNWDVSVHKFSSEKELEEEWVNMRDRLQFVSGQLLRIFKSEEKATYFKEQYLKEVKNKSNSLFFNKFIAWGVKS